MIFFKITNDAGKIKVSKQKKNEDGRGFQKLVCQCRLFGEHETVRQSRIKNDHKQPKRNEGVIHKGSKTWRVLRQI